MTETLSTRRCVCCGALSDATTCPECGHGTVHYRVRLA